MALALSLALCPAAASDTFVDSGVDDPGSASNRLIGRDRSIDARRGDDFVALARRHGTPFSVLASANPDVDPFHPVAGEPLLLPLSTLLPEALPDDGAAIVINLAELRLYHRDTSGALSIYPIGIGRAGADTPLSDTVVTRIDASPSWRPPASIHAEYRTHGMSLPAVVPPGPDNPLGTHAVRLALPNYLLHGTNAPEGVGLRVSHGCIRLYNEDIAELAAAVSPGTAVSIVHRPLKWALEGEAILLEAHRPLAGERYGGARDVRDALEAARRAIADAGLDRAGFEAALAELHAGDALFSGRPTRIPLRRVRPPDGS